MLVRHIGLLVGVPAGLAVEGGPTRSGELVGGAVDLPADELEDRRHVTVERLERLEIVVVELWVDALLAALHGVAHVGMHLAWVQNAVDQRRRDEQHEWGALEADPIDLDHRAAGELLGKLEIAGLLSGLANGAVEVRGVGGLTRALGYTELALAGRRHQDDPPIH